MSLTLLTADQKSSPTMAVEEKLARIRGEVVSALEDRIEELRRESEKMHGTMEQVLYRISTQGFAANLEDLKTGKWHKCCSEVKALQEVMRIFDSYGL